MIQFQYPSAAFLFVLIPIFAYLRWYLWTYRENTLKEIFSVRDRQLGLAARSSKIYWIKTGALLLSWLNLVLAMMQPQGNPRPLVEEVASESSGFRQKAQDVFFLIDASASMEVKDTAQGQSRLAIAKEIAEQLIQRLQGQNVGLYAFTSEATPLTPPTPDYLFTILTLRNIKINEGETAGTDLSEALNAVLDSVQKQKIQKKRTLVLFSDGGDNYLDHPDKVVAKITPLLKKIKELKNKGWDFYVVGVGSEQGAEIPNLKDQGKPVHVKLDERLLKQIIEASGGKYYRAQSIPLLQLAETISQQILEGSSKADPEEIAPQKFIYDHYFQYPLLFATLLLLFVLVYPETEEAQL